MDASRKLLVERVAASRYISKSARLRDLLLYLCEQVLEGSAELHEQEVGRRVFGWLRDYDTGGDNIVRVRASMLRKRLEQYFAEYVAISLLPNLGGNGNVLIVSATGGSAFDAAAAYWSDEAAMVELRQRLPAAKGGAFPYLEALVRVKGRSSLPKDPVVVIGRAPRG